MSKRELGDEYFERKYGNKIEGDSPEEPTLSEKIDRMNQREYNLRQSVRILKDIIDRDYGGLTRRVEELKEKNEKLEEEIKNAGKR